MKLTASYKKQSMCSEYKLLEPLLIFTQTSIFICKEWRRLQASYFFLLFLLPSQNLFLIFLPPNLQFCSDIYSSWTDQSHRERLLHLQPKCKSFWSKDNHLISLTSSWFTKEHATQFSPMWTEEKFAGVEGLFRQVFLPAKR